MTAQREAAAAAAEELQRRRYRVVDVARRDAEPASRHPHSYFVKGRLRQILGFHPKKTDFGVLLRMH